MHKDCIDVQGIRLSVVSTAVSVFACFLEVVHFSKDPLYSEAIHVVQFYSPHREGTLQSSML